MFENIVLTADPLVGAAGDDYHQSPDAEAKDAGAPDHDFGGAPRLQNSAHDIGAFETPAN